MEFTVTPSASTGLAVRVLVIKQDISGKNRRPKRVSRSLHQAYSRIMLLLLIGFSAAFSGPSLFGRDLAEQVAEDGQTVPVIVTKCIEAVETQGSSTNP